MVQHCAFEKAYLCVWVEPSVLSGAERKTVDKAQKKANGAAAFTAPHSIDLSIASRQIESIHLTTLQQIANDLEAVGVVSNIVTCRHLLRDIRLMTEPGQYKLHMGAVFTWSASSNPQDTCKFHRRPHICFHHLLIGSCSLMV